MTAHGQITEFHRDTEEWPSYVERLECYFMTNDVADSTNSVQSSSVVVTPPCTDSFGVKQHQAG